MKTFFGDTDDEGKYLLIHRNNSWIFGLDSVPPQAYLFLKYKVSLISKIFKLKIAIIYYCHLLKIDIKDNDIMNKLLDNTESLLGQLLYSRSLLNSTVLKSKVYCCRPLPFLVDFPLKVLTKLKLIQFTTIKIKAFSGTSACVIISNARKQLCEFGHSELWGNKQLESLWELSPQSEKKKKEREKLYSIQWIFSASLVLSFVSPTGYNKNVWDVAT